MVAQTITDENNIRTIRFNGEVFIVQGNKNDYDEKHQAFILQTYKFLKLIEKAGMTGSNFPINEDGDYDDLLFSQPKALLLIADEELVQWFISFASDYDYKWNNDEQKMVNEFEV